LHRKKVAPNDCPMRAFQQALKPGGLDRRNIPKILHRNGSFLVMPAFGQQPLSAENRLPANAAPAKAAIRAERLARGCRLTPRC
jgi:hypothetical protein